MKFNKFLLSCLLLIFCLKASCEENRLIVCDNGLEMFQWDLDFINEAEQSIEISCCLCGGRTFLEMLSALERRMRQRPELQVYILTSPALMEVDDRAAVKEIEKKHPKNFHFLLTPNVVYFFPEYANIENHLKCVIVDETYFSAGGTNIEEMLCTEGTYTPERDHKKMIGGELFPLGSRDMDIVGKGPIAKELRTLFYKAYAMWEDYTKKSYTKFIQDPEHFKNKTRYRPIDPRFKPFAESFETAENLTSAPDIKLVFSGPMHSSNKITEECTRLIQQAKKEVVIGNIYFNPANKILSACMNAANRNVEMTLITNGINDLTPPYNSVFCWANRINYVPLYYGRDYHFWEFLACRKAAVNNTHVYEYHVKDILYHKKVMVVDRRYTVIGSYNMGVKSDAMDYEIVFVIDSLEIAEQTLKVLERDRIHSLKVDPKDARDWYFNPVTSYLAGTQKQLHSFF